MKNSEEEYYRKLLLLNKVKPHLSLADKQVIFDDGYCWDLLFKDKCGAKLAYDYAILTKKKRFPEAEDTISKSVIYSYKYAFDALHDVFPLAHSLFLQNFEKDTRFRLVFYDYIEQFYRKLNATDKDFLIQAENVMSDNDIILAYRYAKNISQKRLLPENEKKLLFVSLSLRIGYARYIIKGRWPEIENEILTSGNYTAILNYITTVLKGRWPEAEKILKKSKPSYDRYSFFLLHGY